MSHNGSGGAIASADAALSGTSARHALAGRTGRPADWTARQPGAAFAVSALLLTNASTRNLRATLINNGLVVFLALLVLLLILVLVAVIRLPPYVSRPADADSPDGIGFAEVGSPGWDPVATAIGPAAALPAPVRLAGPAGNGGSARSAAQSAHKGYAARHAPGHGPAPQQDTLRLPEVTGGPPWGPAPRPPGLR